MVSSFRVSELQLLLQYAGRCKAGKKYEMMNRAIALVERGCSTPIQIKIRELHRYSDLNLTINLKSRLL